MLRTTALPQKSDLLSGHTPRIKKPQNRFNGFDHRAKGPV